MTPKSCGNPGSLEKAGIGGVTILESTGMQRVKRRMFPMRYLPVVYEQEESHLTLMAIVDDEQLIQACLQATEAVIGNLEEPNTGILQPGRWQS